MAHFAARFGLGFAIEMKMQPACAGKRIKAGHVLTKKIIHLPLPIAIGASQRHASNSADQLGKLTIGAAFDAPVE